jgi:transposase-like protein
MADTPSIAEVMALIEQMPEPDREELIQSLHSADDLAVVIRALEEHADRARQCPHCKAVGAQKRGRVSGLARFQCRACRKTYNALTGTPLARLRMKDRWLEMAAAMAAGDSVRKAASRCDIDKNTSLRWRHRFLRAARGHRKGTKLGGVTERDIAYLRRSEKGSRKLSGGRKARRRGGPKKTDEALVPIFTGVERGGDLVADVLQSETAGAIRYVLGDCLARGTIVVTDSAKNFGRTFRKMAIHHERVNLAQKQRVNGPFHVQTANGIHSLFRRFLRPFNGVATKYLANYLEWFRTLEHRHASTRFAFLSSIIDGAIMGRA